MPIPPSRLSRETIRSGKLRDLQAFSDASAARVTAQQAVNADTQGNDLIDFGQHNSSVPVQAPAQAAPVHPTAPVPVPAVAQGAPVHSTAPIPPYATAQGANVHPVPQAPVPTTAQGAPVHQGPHVPLPADLLAAQLENGGQAQRHLEATLAETATGSNGKPGSQGPLLNFHKDLGQSLQRTDSDTKSLDEFVDAEG